MLEPIKRAGEENVSTLNGFLDSCCGWLSANWSRLVLSAIGVVIVYVGYKFLSRQIARLKNQKKLEESVAFGLTRALKWASFLVVLAVVFTQFGIEVGIIAGFLALAGGTIIGFAAMNTIGNAIAGIIVMVSRPFRIGDRILFNGQFADVVAIDLIYTRMKTLDNVLISVPNQILLTSETDNYGKKTLVRRSCSITAGYELTPEKVEKALLEAVDRVKGVLKEPKPYAWITGFQDFAVEYTVYVFTNQIKRLPETDADLRRTVFATCRRHKIDIRTPSLIQRIEGDSEEVY